MKIGIWNIDHPEVRQSSSARNARLQGIVDYLEKSSCDICILSEANSAINLHGYQSQFSAESPYIKKSRSYKSPNNYHQAAVYSRFEIQEQKISEPVNGVLCKLSDSPTLKFVYGNVITIKDQWKTDSTLKYTDRLNQQMEIIKGLPDQKTLIAGDFNLRLGWPQKARAHKAIRELAETKGLCWPTKQQTDSVQHVLHTSDITVEVTTDQSVKDKLRYSDHPFVTLTVRLL